jgi:hypothetical protein
MMRGTGLLTSAFLHSLSDQGPMSAPLLAEHHFADVTPTLQEALASEITSSMWEAFGQGLVGVYQAERGAPDYFLLTRAGETALATENATA